MRNLGQCLTTLGVILLLTVLNASAAYSHHMDFVTENGTQWAVKVSAKDQSEQFLKLKQLAEEHGCRIIGPVGNLRDYFLLEHDPNHRARRSIAEVDTALAVHPHVEWSEMQELRTHAKRMELITDPLYPAQHHLHNPHGRDLHVIPAWERGLSGRGIAISLVDDGLEWRHKDFGEGSRFLAEGSKDWNGRDDDPTPVRSDDTHGTACAGLAYAGMNDGTCGVGLAFAAKVSGQRLISGGVTDAMEAAALSYRNDLNHIYSCSWGPPDEGLNVEGPKHLMQQTFIEGTTNGRNGKGTIFMWAGGNGGGARDNVNYDGYANSIYSIAIASVNGDGRKADYSEEGAPLVVSATSSPPYVTTTGVKGGCDRRFSGTSASAPMISGVVALMLEANPNLTWRDVQNILLRTAAKNDEGDIDWVVNGAGLHVNHKYGFGLCDAAEATAMAATAPLLPPATTPVVVTWTGSVSIPDRSTAAATIPLQTNANIKVEHVQVRFVASHPRRGDLSITLKSPYGTSSVLALQHRDVGRDYDWTFMSMRHWGESSAGVWTLVVTDMKVGAVGQVTGVTLTLRGTQP
ncbi:peptidase, S8/S53 subfamily protein [Acanthamoeba castellanii str. Neff]|uniref:Peptidase, S8/S53 subfamily protein n=1 Tax=Acanthamoeba castellanii (strain ATCC 30010 / Neff) TaxID=1257118 RepID=L8GV89_ACACF|nr:peptidase, S8/S53 subfamily protein [Acanthamoeba castellanii str. Neff]ELR17094.1 peptidase, S8/S53 subfamily protein [Acanthamoeba castellanii str. Neff]